MELLRRAVDELVAEDPHPLGDAVLGEQLVGLRTQIDRLEAVFLARAAVFDARKLCVDDRHATTASWLRDHCRLAPGDASSRVRMAGTVQPASGLPVPAAAPPPLQGNPPPCGRHP